MCPCFNVSVCMNVKKHYQYLSILRPIFICALHSTPWITLWNHILLLLRCFLQIDFSRTLKIWLIWKEILWSRYKLCLHLNVNEWRNYECVLVGYFTSISSATVTSNFAAPVKSIEINLFVLVQSEISRCFRERARYWYHSNIDCVIFDVLSLRNFLIDHFSMLEVTSCSIHSLVNFQW